MILVLERVKFVFPSLYNTDVKKENCADSKPGRHFLISDYSFKKANLKKGVGTKKPFFLENDMSMLLIVYYFGFQSYDVSLLGN